MKMEATSLIALKKNILNVHLPFIRKTLDQLRDDNPDKKRFKIMLDCITMDKKKMTVDQISKMNSTLLDLKSKTNYKDRIVEKRDESLHRDRESSNNRNSYSRDSSEADVRRRRDDSTKRSVSPIRFPSDKLNNQSTAKPQTSSNPVIETRIYGGVLRVTDEGSRDPRRQASRDPRLQKVTDQPLKRSESPCNSLRTVSSTAESDEEFHKHKGYHRSRSPSRSRYSRHHDKYDSHSRYPSKPRYSPDHSRSKYSPARDSDRTRFKSSPPRQKSSYSSHRNRAYNDRSQSPVRYSNTRSRSPSNQGYKHRSRSPARDSHYSRFDSRNRLPSSERSHGSKHYSKSPPRPSDKHYQDRDYKKDAAALPYIKYQDPRESLTDAFKPTSYQKPTFNKYAPREMAPSSNRFGERVPQTRPCQGRFELKNQHIRESRPGPPHRPIVHQRVFEQNDEGKEETTNMPLQRVPPRISEHDTSIPIEVTSIVTKPLRRFSVHQSSYESPSTSEAAETSNKFLKSQAPQRRFSVHQRSSEEDSSVPIEATSLVTIRSKERNQESKELSNEEPERQSAFDAFLHPKFDERPLTTVKLPEAMMTSKKVVRSSKPCPASRKPTKITMEVKPQSYTIPKLTRTESLTSCSSIEEAVSVASPSSTSGDKKNVETNVLEKVKEFAKKKEQPEELVTELEQALGPVGFSKLKSLLTGESKEEKQDQANPEVKTDAIKPRMKPTSKLLAPCELKPTVRRKTSIGPFKTVTIKEEPGKLTGKEVNKTEITKSSPSLVKNEESFSVSKRIIDKVKPIIKHKKVEAKPESSIAHTRKKARVEPVIEIVESPSKQQIVKSPSKQQIVESPSKQLARNPTKRKLNELDKLHNDINNMYDREGVMHASGPRACTQGIKYKLTHEEKLAEKFELRQVFINVQRLIINEQMPIKLNKNFLLRNPQLKQALEPYIKNDSDNDLSCSSFTNVSSSSRQPEKNKTVSKEEQKEKKSPEVNTLKTTPKKPAAKSRKRSSWSRGVIQKKPVKPKELKLEENSDDEWEDFEPIKQKKSESKSEKMRLSSLVEYMNSFKPPETPKLFNKIMTSAPQSKASKPNPVVTDEPTVLTPTADSSETSSNTSATEEPKLNIPMPLELAKKFVHHFSFKHRPAGVLFKCEMCHFISPEESVFLYHIKSSHKDKAWSQFCYICKKVPFVGSTLEDEFIHLLTHVSNEDANKSIVEKPKPFLTIRNLPGDKLSKPSVPSFRLQAALTVEKPGILLPTPGASLNTSSSLIGKVIPITITQLHSTDVQSTLAEFVVSDVASSSHVEKPKPVSTFPPRPQCLLRPWIRGNPVTKKPLELCNRMLDNNKCLAALFKCMGSTCTYFTYSKTLFIEHLKIHEKNPETDKDGYKMCPYCYFFSHVVLTLVDHIRNEHGSNKFQCSYCFYRANNDFHVFHQHQNVYHKKRPKKVIRCDPLLVRNPKVDVSIIRNGIPKHVPRLSCVLFDLKCTASFYVLGQFKAHLKKSHIEELDAICKEWCESDEVITTNVSQRYRFGNGFGNLQCVYCRFGVDELPKMDNHIAEKHSNRMAIFCERKLPTALINNPPDPLSIDSLTLKEVNKSSPNVEILYVPNDDDVKNLVNFKEIQDIMFGIEDYSDEDLQFSIIPSIEEFSFEKSVLKIRNVCSLFETQNTTSLDLSCAEKL